MREKGQSTETPEEKRWPTGLMNKRKAGLKEKVSEMQDSTQTGGGGIAIDLGKTLTNISFSHQNKKDAGLVDGVQNWVRRTTWLCRPT